MDLVAGFVVVRLPVALLVGEVDLAVLQDGLAAGVEEEGGVVAAARSGIADDRAAEDRETRAPGGRREEVVAGAAWVLGVGVGRLPGQGGPGVEGQLRENGKVGAEVASRAEAVVEAGGVVVVREGVGDEGDGQVRWRHMELSWDM